MGLGLCQLPHQLPDFSGFYLCPPLLCLYPCPPGKQGVPPPHGPGAGLRRQRGFWPSWHCKQGRGSLSCLKPSGKEGRPIDDRGCHGSSSFPVFFSSSHFLGEKWMIL